MKLKNLEQGKLNIKHSVIVKAAEMSQLIDSKALELVHTAQIAGFRPGKTPVGFIKSKYKQQLHSEVVDHFITQSIEDVKSTVGLDLAMQPKVDNVQFEDGQDLSFELELSFLPPVPDVNYADIKLNYYNAEVSDQDINEAIENVRKSHKQFKALPEGTEAKMGNAVLIDAEGSIDGTPIDGGVVKDKYLELGSNEFIPGFEDGLVGAKQGETKTLNLKFPDSYFKDELKGKGSVFVVTVKEVAEVALEEVNDEFAQKFGMKDLQGLKEAIKSQIDKQNKNLRDQIAKKELLDYLEKDIAIELPQALLDQETEIMKKKEDQKLSDEEILRLSLRRVKTGIILASVTKKENVAVSEKDIQMELSKQINSMPQMADQIIDFYTKNKHAAENLRAQIMEDKVSDLMISRATKIDHTVTQKELKEIFDALK